MKPWFPIFCLALPIGCAAPPATPQCAAYSATPTQIVGLYFGRANVPDAVWADFVDRTIVANLPNGYTVLDATGGWMNPRSGATVSQATKVLVVALPDTADAFVPIARIRRAYQGRFDQTSVGMTVQQGCGSF